MAKDKIEVTVDQNEKFKIGEFTDGKGNSKMIYLLNPRDFFAGFGGSRSGLVVSHKTGSLIVRETGPMGLHDCEYDIADKRTWASVFNVVRNWKEVK